MLGRIFRKALLVISISSLCWQIPAGAAERCRWLGTSSNSIEWIQDGIPRGVRLVAEQAGWEWGMTLEGMHHAHCATCNESEKLAAAFRLGIKEPSQSDLDPLDPNNVRALLRTIPGNLFENVGIERTAASIPAPVLGLAGFRSTMVVQIRDHRADLRVFAARDGCFFVIGYSQNTDSVDDRNAFTSIARFERYTPSNPASFSEPKKAEPFPLGDARKKAQENRQ